MRAILNQTAGVLALSSLLALPLAAAAEEPATVKGNGPIQAVTVYPDGATVTRQAKVALPKGRSVVLFEALTPELDEASIRAKLTGTTAAKVTGFSARWAASLEPLRDQESKLTGEIEKVDRAIQAANDRIQALGVRQRVLEQYRNHAKEAMASQAGDKGAATAKWKDALSFVTAEQQSIAEEVRKENRAVEKLHETRNALAQSLAQIRTHEQRKTRTVEVEVEADRAVEATLALDYAVYGAGWFPAYDARQAGKNLALTYYGTVVQGTGEDWKAIDLTLSTARPTQNEKIPTLTAVQLQGHKREKQKVRIVSYGKKAKKDRASTNVVDQTLSGRTSIDDRGTAVVFRVKGKETLPADRRPHKVEITTLELAADTSYEAIPKIAPFVFLKASAANTSNYPILAGEVNVFRSSGFVGTSDLEYVAPGEKFAVSLGVDEELEVRRIIDERVSTAPKLLGSTRTLEYAYSIELENHMAGARTVTLVENVPISQRKEISIAIREGTTKPDEKDDEGFLRWKVELKPGEKRTVHFGYKVEYPKDFQISGL